MHMPSNVTTHFSCRVTRVENVRDDNKDASYAILHYTHMETIPTEVFKAAAIIGCDGVKSAVSWSSYSTYLLSEYAMC
jgi:2-polyprenyl-6-methoxyphenol hydroxylase-like FAD-dependent oxidoreductase